MSPTFVIILFLVFAVLGVIIALRVAASGKRRLSELIAVASLLLVVFGVKASSYAERKVAAEKLSATFVLIEDQVLAGDQEKVLRIVRGGIHEFGIPGAIVDRAADHFFDYTVSCSKKTANQALVPTPTSVTAPAGQEPRQP